jgi:DNA-binding XRE family transcriptional regulator
MTMAKTLAEKLGKLAPARRTKIAARTEALIAEEKSLRDLRRARTLTQRRMARKLGIGQESVSKLENRTDMMLSTLRNYVEDMGGLLNLVAEFPDRPPVTLSGFGSVDKGVLATTAKAAKKPNHKSRS